MQTNPYSIIGDLEERISSWSGSKYGVAVESCTMAILLSLEYRKATQRVALLYPDQKQTLPTIYCPKYTYPGVVCSIIHAGAKINFTDEKWEGIYSLDPVGIIDGALRFCKGMYIKNTLHCLSFHLRKRLNLGRGGMILTDDEQAYTWLKLARFDGREQVPINQQKDFTVLGYNAYMQPADGARAIQLFELLRNKDLPDLPREEQGFIDLSKFPIYQQ